MDIQALLSVENLPVLVGVLIGAIFARMSSAWLSGVLLGLIFGVAAYVGMELFGMAYVNEYLGVAPAGGGLTPSS